MKNNQYDFTKSFINPNIKPNQNQSLVKLTDTDRISKINENMKNLNKYNEENKSNSSLKDRMDLLRKINKNN